MTFNILKLQRLGLALAGLLIMHSAIADSSLKPHSAEYKVKISVLSGRLQTSLTQEANGEYTARHSIRPTGMARLVSRGEIEEMARFVEIDGQVLPIKYQSNDTLSKDKTRADVTFDWNARQMSGDVNGEPLLDTIEGIVLDRLTIQYALMHDLKKDTPGSSYTLFDIDEFKKLNVTLIGEREIKVPAGRFAAIGVQHQAEGSSRVTTLWCVPELDYLPVIIEQHKNDKLRLRASLTRYTTAQTD